MNAYVTDMIVNREDKDTLPYVHITAYQFANLTDEQLQDYRVIMKEKAKSLGMLGTILLGHEGMNFFLSGTDEAALGMAELLKACLNSKICRIKSALVQSSLIRVCLCALRTKL